MKALVTGGAGFVGSHVVENLLSHNWDVIVLDDFSSGREQNLIGVLSDKRLVLVKGDILDSAIVSKLVVDCDVIFHLAAMVSNVKSFENPVLVNTVNVEGTINLLENARKKDLRRFIFASSCGVYGEARSVPIKEDATLAPCSPYAASKASAEQYAFAFHRTYGLEVVALRYTNVYGPRQSVSPYSGVITQFAEHLLNDQPPVIFGDGKQTRDFVYSTDVADATLKAALSAKAPGMAINVGTGLATSVIELAKLMAKTAGKSHLKAVNAEPRPGDVKQSQVNTALARTLLGFQTKVSLSEGLSRFMNWYAGQKQTGIRPSVSRA